MTEVRGRVWAGILAAGLAGSLVAVAAQDRRAPDADRASADPALVLVALRLAPPDPLTDAPQAGLDAARAELAAGFLLSERLPGGAPLTRPAAGQVLEGFGRRQAGGLRAQGLTFRVAPGAEIRAPSGGEVLFAGPLEGFGQAIIIQATPRIQVVLAGDFTARITAGGALREGQALGHVAARGAATNLYLELRDLGRPIDPEPWLRPENASSQGAGFSRETG